MPPPSYQGIYRAPHFMWVGEGCQADLMSPRLVRHVLRRLVKLTGMKPLGRARVVIVDGEAAKGKAFGRGVSGYQLIVDSHIAVDTLADVGIVYIDVFSCRSWDYPLGKELFRLLRPAHAWENTVERALDTTGSSG